MKEKHTQSGITLIALMITIIILLILAVVTINSIKNGKIIDYAKKAAGDYEEKRKEEGSILDSYLSLIDESQNSSNSSSDLSDLIVHEGVIPEGGVYTCADGTEYIAGQKFPETVADEDYYEFGDYEYTLIYNEQLAQFESLEDARKTLKEEIEAELKADETSTIKTWEEWIASDQCPYSTEEEIWNIVGLTEEMFYGYWNVKVKQTDKTQYGKVLEKINGRYITSMQETFRGCTTLTTAPTIPNGVTNMGGTFYNCKSLTTAPVIPSSVNSMLSVHYDAYNDVKWGNGWSYYGCFENCSSLTGSIEVNTDKLTGAYEVKSEEPIGSCYKSFYGTEKEITLTGSASDTVKELLASTANNGNVKY